MIKICGKYNTAICYTDKIESDAYHQIELLCNIEDFHESKIRIMPDVHAGKGCTIGLTMSIKDKVVPNMVGVDIGCGMYTVYLGKVDIDFKKFDEIAHMIPSAKNVWDESKEEFDFSILKCYQQLKNKGRLRKSLGTLGGGNHFIEIDMDDDGNKYLIIHSGSRNLGTQVANYYQNRAIDLNLEKDLYFKKREDIIKTLKQEDRLCEIQTTLEKLKKEWDEKETTVPKDLCFLHGTDIEDYLHDIEICQKFAKRNRELIAEILLKENNLKSQFSFHTLHNYIDTEKFILRKGAVSAKKCEKLLIPLNMRDGCLICIGKGNTEWNESAPHGSGRSMSRTEAFEKLTLKEYQSQMLGIYTTCVQPETLDESPMAYKRMDDIIDQIQPTVDIISYIKPIYNFKASE